MFIIHILVIRPSVSFKFHFPSVPNAVVPHILYRFGGARGEELPLRNPDFRFGKVKAQGILGVCDVIEDYVASVRLQPPLFSVQERFVSDTAFVMAKVHPEG